ncbi:hypothetical protein ABID59_004594 [Bradyrhizobium sp. S3.3.6]
MERIAFLQLPLAPYVTLGRRAPRDNGFTTAHIPGIMTEGTSLDVPLD